MSIVGTASCSSSSSDSDEAPTTETSGPAVGETTPSTPDEAPTGGQEDPVGSGPDGTFLVGDSYSDLDFTFSYEGLVKVDLDPAGEYSEGECFFAVGSATFLDGPLSAVTDRDSFRPSLSPILGGAVDTEQDDEFFNCDFRAVGDLGYTQSVKTNVAVGETASVWLDAIYVSPEQVGQLDGFQIFGDKGPIFSAEMSQDVSS